VIRTKVQFAADMPRRDPCIPWSPWVPVRDDFHMTLYMQESVLHRAESSSLHPPPSKSCGGLKTVLLGTCSRESLPLNTLWKIVLKTL